MANVTRKDGRLQDEKGNWVWGGESYEEVLKHPDWLPLVFQNNESAEKFKKLEKIWKAEQIVKTSKNKQEVMAAKGWLKNNIQHSDGNFIYIPQNDFDFLMHHGIRGQKWGVENGPPYPLSPSKDYSAAEKRLNKVYDKSKKYAEADLKGTENYDRRKNVYDLMNKNNYEKRFDKSIDEARKEINKVANKYKDDKDILSMVDNYTKAIDNMVSDIGDIRLSPEMRDAATKYNKVVIASVAGGGIPGLVISTLGTQKALDKRTGDKSSAYKFVEGKTIDGLKNVRDKLDEKLK